MKKLLMATALIGFSTAAQAQINIEFGAPAYVEPRPVVVEHPLYYNEYGRAHHRHAYDYGYWNHPRPVHAEPPHPAEIHHR